MSSLKIKMAAMKIYTNKRLLFKPIRLSFCQLSMPEFHKSGLSLYEIKNSRLHSFQLLVFNLCNPIFTSIFLANICPRDYHKKARWEYSYKPSFLCWNVVEHIFFRFRSEFCHYLLLLVKNRHE